MVSPGGGRACSLMLLASREEVLCVFVFCSVCLSVSLCGECVLSCSRRICLSTFICGSLCALATAHSLQKESLRYLGRNGHTILRYGSLMCPKHLCQISTMFSSDVCECLLFSHREW